MPEQRFLTAEEGLAGPVLLVQPPKASGGTVSPDTTNVSGPARWAGSGDALLPTRWRLEARDGREPRMERRRSQQSSGPMRRGD